MPWVTGTGDGSTASCHPGSESPMKVAEPSSVPVFVHRWPVRVPDHVTVDVAGVL